MLTKIQQKELTEFILEHYLHYTTPINSGLRYNID